ncbi:MAG: RIP metalloprotease RseP [Candidatus Omnitrophica bacterium]|jgi:regulator of sigma E protease|nr:RIP metalloprotease RseP [Candidatus Omnitrophota bacterium]
MGVLAFFLILGILIIVHEFGHFIIARKAGIRVEKFSLGFGPAILRKKTKQTEYTLNAVALGGYVKLAGDSLEDYTGKADEYLAQKPSRRAAVVFAGPLLNYLLGIFCFWLIFVVGYPALTNKVGGLLDGYGAKTAGIQAGDKIVNINGKRILFWEELQRQVQDASDKSSLEVVVLRGEKEINFTIPLKDKQVEDLIGQKKRVGLLGVIPAEEFVTVRYNPFKALYYASLKSVDLTVMTYRALWFMVSGRLSFRDSVTGPLGIFYITNKTAGLGILALVHLVGILSISLALFNILPFPVLDGGHLFFLLVEKIRGKGLSPKADQIVANFGMTAIIALAIFVTYNDILKFKDKLFGFFIK